MVTASQPLFFFLATEVPFESLVFPSHILVRRELSELSYLESTLVDCDR
jgi:hypothetical protein